MTDNAPQFLDGNVAAGAVGVLFATDVTAAAAQCAGCRTVRRLAATHVYAQAPGMVVRCPSCDAVMARIVEGPSRTWVDLTGIGYLEIANAPDRALEDS